MITTHKHQGTMWSGAAGRLVEARMQKCSMKACGREITPPVPPRERKGAAERSNRFVRALPPGTARVRLEIARRRREATLQLGEKLYKIGPRTAPAACPAWPEARECRSSITGASAKNTVPQQHLMCMHSCTSVTEQQLDVAICQDAAPARPAAAWPAGATFPWPLSRESPSGMSRASAAIARRRREASRLCEELYKKMDQMPS